ncbi:hypothetical protein TCAL_08251 [Tigriopus californicus]|uniref:G-protein coupled receptors family 3 profile domain-containing protein n=1 Tax=Tigriopus californicus TaxID=6832 RepID=A0A553NY14_TIGCA|nr:hypothetical protein TCAL_08251 [Tigriopus californicus]
MHVPPRLKRTLENRDKRYIGYSEPPPSLCGRLYGAQGDEIGDVKFNGDGDRIGRYSIFQYQKVPDEGYKYIQVGEFGEFPDWTYKHKISRAHQVGMTQQLALNTFIMQWPNVSEMGTPPLSVCSHSCRMGHIKSFTDACCWTCVPCRDDSIVVDEDSCYQCPLGYVPNDEKNQCLRLDAEALEGQSPWVFFPLVFSSVGMVMTLEVVAVFIYYNRTSIIMASGRELSYVLLGGIFFSYACPFVILSEPGAITCSMIRLGLGLCLCVCYSAIFTKTNRIYRIFHGCMKGNQKPAYISPKSQLVICSGLISVQLLGVSIWLAIEPPSVRVFHPSREVAVLTCGTSNFSLAISLGYNMALIFLCTWYAIKTRKVPENFNEAKYIGFTMYATCIIWLSFIPIFFGTKNDFEIQISSMCMCVILSATVTLFCLFMPKIYIVMLHPEKCARSLPGGGKSGAGSGGATGGPTSVGKNKMRFTKSQDSSISNISDTFNARTPQTPLTPLTPKTPSSHHPSTNSNHQNHNKEDVVQIETRKNSTLNPVSITTTEIHVSFSEPNDIHEIPRYDDEETSTSHQENSLTNGHTDSPPLPPIPFAQPPPPSMVTSMAVTSNIKTNPAFDDKMSLVNEVKETQQYGEAEDYYDSEDDDWSGS